MLYSEKEGGMGLGLSVASNIVRAHGGRLIVGNRPEGGAVVRILL
jgi:C4-dicarboxylate-specific signal transduction histidine kinase